MTSAAQAQARQPTIWFAPMQPLQRPDGAQAGSIDYFTMFEPSASWAFAATHVSVFKIYPELLRDATDDQVLLLISGLAARNIALGLEAPVLADPSRCETPATSNAWVIGLVARLKHLGGDLRTFAMVGPLVSGHGSSMSTACHRPIPDVIAAAARTVAGMRQFYPSLVVGEIEPIGHGSAYPDWSELTTWFSAWSKASGKPLAFLHMDTGWGTNWTDDMRKVAKQVHESGIRFGVIYKGDPFDLSDDLFTGDALRHADEVETLLSGAPDDVILQSWENYPRHALPDTDMSTMTGLVRAYLRQRTHLVLKEPTRVQLVRDDKTPLDRAEIVVEVHDPAPEQTLQEQLIEGTAPHTAISAMFALRVHAECARESSPVNLSLANYDFHQQGANDDFHGDLRPWSIQAAPNIREVSLGGTSVLRVHAAQSRQIELNGPRFSVVADQPFTLKFLAQVEPESERAGCIALIFFRPDGNEVQRVPQLFQTSWRELLRLHTQPDGTVSLPALRHPPGSIVRLRFSGDLLNRPSALSLDSASLAKP